MESQESTNEITCPTYTAHATSYYSWKHKGEKKRFKAKALMEACVKLLESYKSAGPDVTPEDHANSFLPTLHAVHSSDRVFLTQVLYGCCRYNGLLKILTTKLVDVKSPRVQVQDEALYTAFGYLVLMRLEELNFQNFRRLVLSQSAQKLLPFVEFIFKPEILIKHCQEEWIQIYDIKYVKHLIQQVKHWSSEAQELRERLEDKVYLKKERASAATVVQPFNFSPARVRTVDIKEEKPAPYKARPAPLMKKGPSQMQKVVEAACIERRKKLSEFYSDPKNQPFQLRILERPSNMELIKAEAELKKKLDTEYHAPKARPCPSLPSKEVKLTIAAVLREHALYQKRLEEEKCRIEAFELQLRDDSEFKSWQEEMRLKHETAEALEKSFRKAAVDASDQAAAEAKNAKAQENREIALEVKEESQKLAALKTEFIQNLDLFNRLKHESIMETQRAAKLALTKVAVTKKTIAQQIQAETAALAAQSAQERALDLKCKQELVRQLRALEVESTPMTKKFDRNTIAGHRLLGEMSVAELQERLVLLKEALQKEENFRRAQITTAKEETLGKLLSKAEMVKKMRQISKMQRIVEKELKK